MLISIDHGNFAIKTPNFVFSSGLVKHTVKPPLVDEVIEYNGYFWAISNKRLSYRRNKTENEDFFVLSLFAIAQELRHSCVIPHPNQVIPIELSIGLPPEHFGGQYKKFEEYFLNRGIIKFKFNDDIYNIKIDNVYCFPQAYAAALEKTDFIKNNSRTFIVDIGGYTVDVLQVNSQGKLNTEFLRSFELGVITMNNEIIRKVNSLEGMLLDDESISEVIQGKNTILPESVRNLILNEVGDYVEKIINELRENNVDLRVVPAIFCGGGAIMLKSFIEKSKYVVRPEFILDQKANACGYKRMAMGRMKKKS